MLEKISRDTLRVAMNDVIMQHEMGEKLRRVYRATRVIRFKNKNSNNHKSAGKTQWEEKGPLCRWKRKRCVNTGFKLQGMKTSRPWSLRARDPPPLYTFPVKPPRACGQFRESRGAGCTPRSGLREMDTSRARGSLRSTWKSALHQRPRLPRHHLLARPGYT